jgi:S-adenosylmethionine decarboxylase
MMYSPGLHILAEIKTDDSRLLTAAAEARDFFYERIRHYDLHALGDVFHTFDNGAFTGIICLTESHLALHTWPEHGLLTFDVYLSNYLKANDGTARQLMDDTLAYFKAQEQQIREVKR